MKRRERRTKEAQRKKGNTENKESAKNYLLSFLVNIPLRMFKKAGTLSMFCKAEHSSETNEGDLKKCTQACAMHEGSRNHANLCESHLEQKNISSAVQSPLRNTLAYCTLMQQFMGFSKPNNQFFWGIL